MGLLRPRPDERAEQIAQFPYRRVARMPVQVIGRTQCNTHLDDALFHFFTNGLAVLGFRAPAVTHERKLALVAPPASSSPRPGGGWGRGVWRLDANRAFRASRGVLASRVAGGLRRRATRSCVCGKLAAVVPVRAIRFRCP